MIMLETFKLFGIRDKTAEKFRNRGNVNKLTEDAGNTENEEEKEIYDVITQSTHSCFNTRSFTYHTRPQEYSEH